MEPGPVGGHGAESHSLLLWRQPKGETGLAPHPTGAPEATRERSHTWLPVDSAVARLGLEAATPVLGRDRAPGQPGRGSRPSFERHPSVVNSCGQETAGSHGPGPHPGQTQLWGSEGPREGHLHDKWIPRKLVPVSSVAVCKCVRVWACGCAGLAPRGDTASHKSQAQGHPKPRVPACGTWVDSGVWVKKPAGYGESLALGHEVRVWDPFGPQNVFSSVRQASPSARGRSDGKTSSWPSSGLQESQYPRPRDLSASTPRSLCTGPLEFCPPLWACRGVGQVRADSEQTGRLERCPGQGRDRRPGSQLVLPPPLSPTLFPDCWEQPHDLQSPAHMRIQGSLFKIQDEKTL
ncbi:uncharacterized protein LOC117096284 [Trachypithecus francoisi]|uniref:uncharacterized protein LOC117096284 n=1 Tax=Trachypithecus francoisi TaxID=54180 RepID=UPI00141BF511|nr:uncharacterized protein LOC117096284 [Trachypithecus francoisi]